MTPAALPAPGKTPEERAYRAAVGSLPPSQDPIRRLSWWRVGCVLVVLLAAAGALVAFRPGPRRPIAAVPVSSFMPYVDVTATPIFAFEDPSTVTAANVALAFVVSPTGLTGVAACQPSWGGVYSLDSAMSGLDLDRRIARVQQRGGGVTVSFGGAANAELAIGCDDSTRLTNAYNAVVSRYSLSRIDLDIESKASSTDAVNARRAAAIKNVQDLRAVAGHPLAVWLTLPVNPTGLNARGIAVLRSMLDAKVTLAGVNAMTMDYAQPTLPATMGQLAQDALTSVARQLTDAYRQAGTVLSADQAWQKVGATAMIGQNDVSGERFELTDAQALLDFAKAHHMLRISIWSANRDQSCGVNYANPEVVSDQCSGVTQDWGSYDAIFNGFASLAGPATQVIGHATVSPSASASTAQGTTDNPAASPYPIWSPSGAYPKNTKIVWHHNVYEAKWWSQGEVPDAPVSDPTSTPWVLIGPVLPGEHPVALPTLSEGTFPDWDPTQIYVAGQRVLFNGVGYQAKWWTQNQQPQPHPLQPSDTPWELITSSG